MKFPQPDFSPKVNKESPYQIPEEMMKNFKEKFSNLKSAAEKKSQ
jgi:hypothetical protein